jgi:uncharacterized protein (UPF0332 family)
MTDLETLSEYRLKQARETLDEARRMAEETFSPRSITNRAYYAARLDGDYREMVEIIPIKAQQYVAEAQYFIDAIQFYIKGE